MLVLALALAARAAPLTISAESSSSAAEALSRQLALVPAWIGALVVAAVRAGSHEMADLRGINAVAGLGVIRGGVLMVAAAWLALAAGAVALVWPAVGARAGAGLLVAESPFRRLEAIAVALQAGLLVTFFLGPQVNGFGDVVPWVAGMGAAAAVLWFGRRWVVMQWPVWAANIAGVAAVALALAGGRL